MKRMLAVLVVLAGSTLLLAGCMAGTPEKPPKGPSAVPTGAAEDARIKENLDRLDPEDRKLARAQKWCAVEEENPLGDMGTPYKLLVKGEPVFLCCKSCAKRALADPDRTLAHVAALKARAAETR